MHSKVLESFLDCPQLDFCLTHILSEKTKSKFNAVLQHIQVKVIIFIVIRGKIHVSVWTFLCLVPYQLVLSKGNNSLSVEGMFSEDSQSAWETTDTMLFPSVVIRRKLQARFPVTTLFQTFGDLPKSE